MTPDEFRQAGHKLVDWIADYRATVESRPVIAQSAPGDIKAKLPAAPPKQGESFDAIAADIDTVVMPGITNWQHPRFFGYFPSNGLFASVLGDLLSSGLGVIGLAWQSSPALTEV
jgi:aromatic-L-amino-acid decarboxylase